VVGGEWNGYDRRRRIAFPGIDRSAHGETDGALFETMFGNGYDFKLGKKLTLGLFDSLEYTTVSINGFSEEVARSLDLAIADQNAPSLRSHSWGVYAQDWFDALAPQRSRSLET
jgi:uncharacterized protein YhjY with autotransporter beta-barrel domain